MTPGSSLSGSRSGEPQDARVDAVLEVLAGRTLTDVAHTREMDPELLHRWLDAFLAAGTAQVTNRPDPDTARQRDRFLSAFAHEIRSPLSIAQGWVSLLRDGDVPADQHERSLHRLDAALGDLADRTLDIELLTAASLGRLEVRHESVAASVLLGDLPGPAGHGAGADVVLAVDPLLFSRVLRDLWRAIQLGPSGCEKPTVSAATVGPWCELRFVRRGEPMDQGLLRALFEPFDLNTDGSGVTIGLYLARALTVAHGGTLGADQSVDETAIWVRVPGTPVLRHNPLHDPAEEVDHGVQARLW